MTTSETLRFRPTFRATVIAVPLFLVLVGLGTWQLQRLSWKTELIAYRQAQLAAAPVTLPDDVSGEGTAAFEFRRVTVSGAFLHDREIFLAATRQGKVGFRVITPIRRPGGAVVLVDRGWVPAEARDPSRRAEGQIEGPVSVEGVVRSGARRGWFTPDNDPARNYWFWFDLPAMAAFAGIEAPRFVIEAGPAPNPGGLPMGREMRVELRNEHLEYAVTWYCLALALAVIFVLSQRTRPQDGA